jgi:hypothetical protein
MERLKEYMSSGRGAHGPPAPLPPEPEPQAKATFNPQPMGLFANSVPLVSAPPPPPTSAPSASSAGASTAKPLTAAERLKARQAQRGA